MEIIFATIFFFFSIVVYLFSLFFEGFKREFWEALLHHSFSIHTLSSQRGRGQSLAMLLEDFNYPSKIYIVLYKHLPASLDGK